MAVLALNTRLGCLEPDLPKVGEKHHIFKNIFGKSTRNKNFDHQGSEQETLIKAVGDMFLLNGKLDDGMQLWRYMPIQGPAMRKFETTCQVLGLIFQNFLGHISCL